jgi:hypothetical protein
MTIGRDSRQTITRHFGDKLQTRSVSLAMLPRSMFLLLLKNLMKVRPRSMP